MEDDYAESLDDAEILEKLAENLDDYFHLLVGKYEKPLFRVAWSMLSNPQDAEEITQDTFVRAYLALSKMIKEGQDIRLHIHLKPWLFTIARNTSLNRRRHEGQSLPSIPLDTNEEGDLVEGPSCDQGSSAEDEAIQRENNDELYRQLGQIPQRQREIIILYYIGGLSDPEIVGVLEQKPNTIKKARLRALERLRDMMSGDVEE